MRVWKLGIRETVELLADAIQPAPDETIEDVIAQYTAWQARRQAIHGLWATAASPYAANIDTRFLPYKLCKFSAVLNAYPDARDDTYCHRVFGNRKMTDDTDVLITPYFDAPGRLNAFVVSPVQRQSGKQVVLQPFGSAHDFGLAGMDALIANTPQYHGNVKYIILDDCVYQQLHDVSLQSLAYAPPVATLHISNQTDTADVWQWFNTRNLVFWSPDISQAIEQARRLDSYVSLFTLPDETLTDAAIRQMSPRRFLSAVQLQVMPWRAAIATYLSRQPDISFGACLNLLRIPVDELLEITINQPKLHTRIKEAAASLERTIRFDATYVSETPTGWWVRNVLRRIRITNFTYRLNEITILKNQKLWTGSLYHDDKAIPFTLDMPTFDYRWYMPQFAALAKAAGCSPLLIKKHWGSKLYAIASQFHAPRTTQKTQTGIGWDKQQSCFTFLRYRIADGQISTHNIQFPTAIYESFSQTDWPTIFSSDDMQSVITDTPQNRQCWSLVFSLLQRLLCESVNKNHRQLLLSSPNGLQIFEASGCPTIQQPGTPQNVKKQITSMLVGLPYVLTASMRTKSSSLRKLCEQNVVRACRNRAEFLILRLLNLCDCLDTSLVGVPPLAFQRLLSHVLAFATRDAAHLQLPSNEACHELLKQWFTSHGQQVPNVIDHLLRSSQNCQTYCADFAQIAIEAVTHHKFRASMHNGLHHSVLIFDDRRKRRINISKAAMRRFSLSVIGSPLPVDQVTASLQQCGALYSTDSADYWVLSYDWWQAMCEPPTDRFSTEVQDVSSSSSFQHFDCDRITGSSDGH